MKNIRGYPLSRGRVSRQSPRVRGWLPPENILCRHFEMDLKLTDHVRNTVSLLYKQKTGWNSDIWNFFSEKFIFGLYLAENRHFQVGHVLLRHCDVIRLTDFHDFSINGKRRSYPMLWYQTTRGPILWAYQFQHHGGGNHPHLGRRVRQKGSGRRGLTYLRRTVS